MCSKIRPQRERRTMEPNYKEIVTKDPSDFVLLADHVPSIVQETRYYSTYNFIGDRIDGYEDPSIANGGISP